MRRERRSREKNKAQGENLGRKESKVYELRRKEKIMKRQDVGRGGGGVIGHREGEDQLDSERAEVAIL
jgi:hypothetical protein